VRDRPLEAAALQTLIGTLLPNIIVFEYANEISVALQLATAELVASPSMVLAARLHHLASPCPPMHDAVLLLEDRRARVASMATAAPNMGENISNDTKRTHAYAQ
jgi:hypothetical protein